MDLDAIVAADQERVRRLPYYTESRADTACAGCGMVDPCGVHYADCVLLEPGDLTVPRGATGEAREAGAAYYAGPCRACAWYQHDCGNHYDEPLGLD